MKPREIKFRVWDKENQKFWNSKNGATFYTSIEELPVCLCGFLSKNRFIVQQFTGLYDKNARPIHEGDILKVKSYDSWSDRKGFYYNSAVFYQEETASFVHANRPELGVGNAFIHPRAPYERDYEVIGNIFENKELLSKPNEH